MTTMYRLKLALIKPYYPMTKCSYVFDVSDNITFGELHSKISETLGIFVPFFEFYLTKFKLASYDDLSKFMLKNPDKAINKLTQKDYFYYKLSTDNLPISNKDSVFMLIRLRVEKVFSIHQTRSDSQFLFELTDQIGAFESPFQDFDKNLSIMAGLIMIATSNPPVRLGELEEAGIAKELITQNLIKPCLSPTHLVRLTSYGESVLAHLAESLSK